MPCVLKAVHNTGHFHGKVAHCIRSMASGTPGIVASDSGDAAVIALMVVLFALLGTAIVLAAVFFSKRSLDKEAARADRIELRPVASCRSSVKGRPLTGTSRAGTTIDKDRESVSPSHSEAAQGSSSARQSLRGRRGMSDVSIILPNPKNVRLPKLPSPAHRSGPDSGVFPGVKYEMRQMGNDGKVHRPESIFEHLRP